MKSHQLGEHGPKSAQTRVAPVARELLSTSLAPEPSAEHIGRDGSAHHASCPGRYGGIGNDLCLVASSLGKQPQNNRPKGGPALEDGMPRMKACSWLDHTCHTTKYEHHSTERLSKFMKSQGLSNLGTHRIQRQPSWLPLWFWSLWGSCALCVCV